MNFRVKRDKTEFKENKIGVKPWHCINFVYVCAELSSTLPLFWKIFPSFDWNLYSLNQCSTIYAKHVPRYATWSSTPPYWQKIKKRTIKILKTRKNFVLCLWNKMPDWTDSLRESQRDIKNYRCLELKISSWNIEFME